MSGAPHDRVEDEPKPDAQSLPHPVAPPEPSSEVKDGGDAVQNDPGSVDPFQSFGARAKEGREPEATQAREQAEETNRTGRDEANPEHEAESFVHEEAPPARRPRAKKP